MQALDLIFFVLMGILVLRGFLKGFAGELFSLASLALALVASLMFFNLGAIVLRSVFKQELMQTAPVPEILAFAGIFLVVFIMGKFAGSIVKGIIVSLKLDGLDKILGLVLGFAEALAIIGLVIFLLNIQTFFDPGQLFDKSIFARFILPLFEGNNTEAAALEGTRV